VGGGENISKEKEEYEGKLMGGALWTVAEARNSIAGIPRLNGGQVNSVKKGTKKREAHTRYISLAGGPSISKG